MDGNGPSTRRFSRTNRELFHLDLVILDACFDKAFVIIVSAKVPVPARLVDESV